MGSKSTVAQYTKKEKKKKLLSFPSVTTAETRPLSLILTVPNDSPSNLTNYICTAVSESRAPIEAYVNLWPTIKGKGQLQLRVQGLYHSLTF